MDLNLRVIFKMNPTLKNSNYLIVLVYIFFVTIIGYFFVFKNNYLNLHIPIRIGKIVFNKGLAKEAQKILPGANYVIHLEDMHIDWTDNKLTDVFGYTKQELLTKKSFDLAVSSHLTKEEYLNEFLKRIVEDDKENYTIITQKMDKSDVLIKVACKTFSYRNQNFLAGKIVDYRTPTEEEIKKFELEYQ